MLVRPAVALGRPVLRLRLRLHRLHLARTRSRGSRVKAAHRSKNTSRRIARRCSRKDYDGQIGWTNSPVAPTQPPSLFTTLCAWSRRHLRPSTTSSGNPRRSNPPTSSSARQTGVLEPAHTAHGPRQFDATRSSQLWIYTFTPPIRLSQSQSRGVASVLDARGSSGGSTGRADRTSAWSETWVGPRHGADMGGRSGRSFLTFAAGFCFLSIPSSLLKIV